MKDPTDRSTGDLLAEKRPRGRPRKAHTLSEAERAKRYRQRRLLNAGARPVLLTAQDRAIIRRLIRDDQSREAALSGAGGLSPDSEWLRLLADLLPKLAD
jgi:hypothetical protein